MKTFRTINIRKAPAGWQAVFDSAGIVIDEDKNKLVTRVYEIAHKSSANFKLRIYAADGRLLEQRVL